MVNLTIMTRTVLTLTMLMIKKNQLLTTQLVNSSPTEVNQMFMAILNSCRLLVRTQLSMVNLKDLTQVYMDSTFTSPELLMVACHQVATIIHLE